MFFDVFLCLMGVLEATDAKSSIIATLQSANAEAIVGSFNKKELKE
jgi:hypothetical protein